MSETNERSRSGGMSETTHQAMHQGMVKDPVCGMEIDPAKAYTTREHDGQTFYFCSKSCVDKFDADPHKYGHPPKHSDHEQHQKH